MHSSVGLQSVAPTESIPAPTPWPGANARLLGVGAGLPVKALDRLAQFDSKDFERFTLEWVAGYLAAKVTEIIEVQQRGGAGDKGRDVLAYLDPSSVSNRRWRLYQCKHYGTALGASTALGEIAKVLFYTLRGDYTVPEEYHFVTHKGVTTPFQDLLDAPETLRAHVLENWDKDCRNAVGKQPVELDDAMKAHIASFAFSIFRAKQPHQLIEEHKQTQFHLAVFGLPLIERPPPPPPPSEVAPGETRYVDQLFQVIAAELSIPITAVTDFAHDQASRRLFDRSRITFYCAEGLKELARDRMADVAFFDTLLDEFSNGLYHWYSASGMTGLQRLTDTVKGAQQLQLGGHMLAPHVQANDREGMCHQLANEDVLHWCDQ